MRAVVTPGFIIGLLPGSMMLQPDHWTVSWHHHNTPSHALVGQVVVVGSPYQALPCNRFPFLVLKVLQVANSYVSKCCRYLFIVAYLVSMVAIIVALTNNDDV